MRYSGDWMALVDDRVLEYLRENGSGSPTEMKEEGPIRYSSQYIGRRCKKLKENGLVQHLGNGVYIITDDGEAYLDGRLDTQEWRYIDDDASEVTASSSEDIPGESNGGAT
ncbi:phage repressor protein [Halorubrum sp. DM2]|uniref:phage repressor protein n=1 Tax=Halorubrum sp. DM2 TaxID=2527867 RepID=UPI0024B675BA|nr:phage repressor protein [Halorubrum sp. DM2]